MTRAPLLGAAVAGLLLRTACEGGSTDTASSPATPAPAAGDSPAAQQSEQMNSGLAALQRRVLCWHGDNRARARVPSAA